MALPIIDTPLYELKIPSNGKKIRFRPFLVKEEKILMLAMEESKDDPKAVFRAMRQVVINCTFGEVPVDVLTSYDVEFIFMEIRKKAAGAMVDLTVRCKNVITDLDSNGEEIGSHECGQINDFAFNLEEAKLDIPKDRNSKIMITGDIGIQLKDPTFGSLEKFQEDDKKAMSETEKLYGIICSMIDCVYKGEEIQEPESQEALMEWIETLPPEVFNKLVEYAQTIPTLKAKIKVKCSKCGNEDEIALEGLQSFLAL